MVGSWLYVVYAPARCIAVSCDNGSLRGVIYNIGFALATVMIGVYVDIFGTEHTINLLWVQTVGALVVILLLMHMELL